MRRIGGLILAAMLLLIDAPASARPAANPVAEIDVMSQNLYLGADINRVLEGEPPAAVLQTVLQTDYPGRAAKIADTIGANRPDVVGLQEAMSIVVFDSHGNILSDLDFLQILKAELAAQGHPYEVSSSVTNADVTLPIDPPNGIFARVVDRDVIIHNTETTTVANPTGENFSTNFTFELGGVPIEFTRGFTGVDATVDGRTFRFVNTHLEVQNAPCSTPAGLIICQDTQAAELIDALDEAVYPTILVGDFNAAPGETAYETIVADDYVDTWNSKTETGATCCQAETLDNEVSLLHRRIDHLFVQRQGVKVVTADTTVLGDEPESRTADGLWSSDHGAPFAELRLVIPGDVGARRDVECMQAGLAVLQQTGLLPSVAADGLPIATAVSVGVTVRDGADVSGIPDPIPLSIVLADHRAGDRSVFVYPWCP